MFYGSKQVPGVLVSFVLTIALALGMGCFVTDGYAKNASEKNTSLNLSAERHAPITHKLIGILENDGHLKQLVEDSIAQAARINPDRKTNPAQNLQELYSFIDYSITRMPWNILDDSQYESFAAKCDQSILYIYFLLDQPLDALKDKNLFYPSVEYLEPIYMWLSDYNNAWKAYLDSEDSWRPEYYTMLFTDPTWNLDKGWYESPENWHTFNEFFARKLANAHSRPIASPENESIVASPADSLPQGTWTIDEKGGFLASAILDEKGVEIKSSVYVTVEQILGKDGAAFAKRFHEGTLTHTYLNYDDYHRYHMPVSGTVFAKYIVPHANAVGGVVYWDTDRKLYVLESNSLSWQAVETRGCVIIDTGAYGLVAVLPIGMGQVSSVNFEDTVQVGAKVKKGAPLGYFLFGGSDCVMLFEKRTGFELTAPKGAEGGYANGYAHVLCGEQYGVMHGRAQ